MSVLLRFDQVDVAIEGAAVLRDASFTVSAGETLALVGRNGAGKTTTLRTIMGFLAPTAGSILDESRSLTALKPEQRTSIGIGYAPEDRRLFSAFDVEENLLLPVRVLKLGADECARRLARVYELLPELETLRTRPAGSVSGGQGKMVALGRAMMTGTRLVLLDEPFQGLAPVLARRYAEALGRLRERDPDVAILVTESNPALLEDCADRLLEIERGEVR